MRKSAAALLACLVSVPLLAQPVSAPIDPMANDKVASYEWVRPAADYVRREVMIPMRDGVRLAGVNSINWARVLAQVVYYFSAAVSLGAPHRAVSFTVPTGNFGDIFAGYIARQMGLLRPEQDLTDLAHALANFSLLIKGDNPLPMGSNEEIADTLRLILREFACF